MRHATEQYGLAAEFGTAGALVEAARRVRAEGYRRCEAYSPFPIEELEEVLAMRRTRIPLVMFIAGVCGALTGFFMCWYAFVISYPLNVGGRPHNSWPAWIPLTFELMVLFAGLAGGIGLIVASGLPRLHHPIFNTPHFERASQDRFFLCIEARDPKFERVGTEAFLRSLLPESCVEVPW